MHSLYRISIKLIRAFSILEASLVVAISGVMLSVIIPVYKILSKSYEHKNNEFKATKIRLAIQSYVLRNGYLPFASSGDGFAKVQTFSGFIPYKTLGLDKKFSVNSRAVPFKFVVNKHLTQAGGSFSSILLPPFAKPNVNKVTFCRLYTFEKDEILKYDKICDLESIDILENGKSIIDPLSSFFVMPPISNFSYVGEMQRWASSVQNLSHPKYKVCDTIAWVLISSEGRRGKKTNCQLINENPASEKFCLRPEASDHGIFDQKFYYQTRFDLASQIGRYCGSEPIDLRS
jgi:hypothetical protein